MNAKTPMIDFEFPELPPNWHWWLGELRENKYKSTGLPESHFLPLRAMTGVYPNDMIITQDVYIEWQPNAYGMTKDLLAAVEKASTQLADRVWEEVKHVPAEVALMQLYRKANMTQDLTAPDRFYNYEDGTYSEEAVEE